MSLVLEKHTQVRTRATEAQSSNACFVVMVDRVWERKEEVEKTSFP
jgi:hypothetical protein